MTTERAVRLLAGSLVLAGVALGYAVHPAWLLLAAFAGINLVQSAFSGFCPAERILRRLGLPGCETPAGHHRAPAGAPEGR